MHEGHSTKRRLHIYPESSSRLTHSLTSYDTNTSLLQGTWLGPKKTKIHISQASSLVLYVPFPSVSKLQRFDCIRFLNLIKKCSVLKHGTKYTLYFRGNQHLLLSLLSFFKKLSSISYFREDVFV